MPDTRTTRQRSLRWAVVLYSAAALVLLSPVTSEKSPESGDGAPTGSSVCGLTLTHAFVTVLPEQSGDRRADCAEQASDRVGYGLALLLLALPAGFVAAVGQRD